MACIRTDRPVARTRRGRPAACVPWPAGGLCTARSAAPRTRQAGANSCKGHGPWAESTVGEPSDMANSPWDQARSQAPGRNRTPARGCYRSGQGFHAYPGTHRVPGVPPLPGAGVGSLRRPYRRRLHPRQLPGASFLTSHQVLFRGWPATAPDIVVDDEPVPPFETLLRPAEPPLTITAVTSRTHERPMYPRGLNSGKTADQTCIRSCPCLGKWTIPVGVA